jgi:Flp pilus assembly protein TadG
MIATIHALTAWVRCRRGASAVEFAIVFPLFLFALFGIVMYGAYLAVVHGVQQLAASAARSSVAGLSEAERVSLAESYVQSNATAYPLIAPGRLTVRAGAAPDNANVYIVTVGYDASHMFIYALPGFVPAPSPHILRAAAIQRGGY